MPGLQPSPCQLLLHKMHKVGYEQVAKAFWRNKSAGWAQNKLWWGYIVREKRVDLPMVQALEQVMKAAPPDANAVDLFTTGPLENFSQNAISASNSRVAYALTSSRSLAPLLKSVWPPGVEKKLHEIAHKSTSEETNNGATLRISKKLITDYWVFQQTWWAREKVRSIIKEPTREAVALLDELARTVPNTVLLRRFATSEFYDFAESLSNIDDKKAIAEATLRSPILHGLFSFGRTKSKLKAIEMIASS